MAGFIFGGDTGATYEQVQRRRRIADQLMEQGAAGTPRNVGEGISSFAKSITGALVGRKAAKRDDELRAEANSQFESVFSGMGGGSMPSYTSPAPTGAPVTPVATAPLQDTPQAIGNDAMAAIGQPSNDPATRIRNGLTERGLPPHVADAFVMNFQDESNLDPGINEIEPIVPGSRGGFGLAQWTGPRRRALEQFAQERGMPVSDENLQMDFLMQELQGPESRAAQTIMSSRDAPTAAAAIVNDFLRPAEVNRARREAQYTGGATPQGQGGGRPNVSTQQIVELLGNPYIAQDPAKAAVLQSLLQQNLAGPQGAFSILSGQEAAQFGLPTDGVFQRAPDGRITQVGGGGTNVDITLPGQDPDKFREKLDESSAAMFTTLYDQLPNAQRSIAQVDNLGRLLEAAPTGRDAAIKSWLGGFGIETEGLSEVQALEAAISQMVPEQRVPGSGPMSDADLALFKRSLPRLINTPEGNQRILATMRGLAQYQSDQAKIAAQVVSGSMTRTEGQEALMALPNPLADIGNIPEPPQGGVGEPDLSTMSIEELEAIANGGGG